MFMSNTLHLFKSNIWYFDMPFTRMGVHVGCRMTIIKLDSGDLWVHSPTPVSEDIIADIKQLGTVRYVVAPNQFHYLFITDFLTHFPDATLIAAPTLSRKHPKLPITHTLDPNVSFSWQSELPFVLINGMPKVTESVFFHRASQTLIVTDLFFNIHDTHPWTQLFFKLNGGCNHLMTTKLYHTFIKDKPAFYDSITQILQFPFTHLIMAHGTPIHDTAKDMCSQIYTHCLSSAS